MKPRRQSHKLKSRIVADRRRQETPEQRADRLEKCRKRAAVRRASETQESKEARLARDRARISASRRNLKDRARVVNLKLHLLQSLSSRPSTSSKATGLRGRELVDYKAYTRYNEQLKAAANSAATRRSQETPEQRALRLEKCRVRAAAIRACESMEERAARLSSQRMRVKETRLQAKRQEQGVGEPVSDRTRNKSKAAQRSKLKLSPLAFWQSQIKVMNRFRPRFRAGLCPKSAGNCSSLMASVNIECDVEVDEEEDDPLDTSQEPLFETVYLEPHRVKQEPLRELQYEDKTSRERQEEDSHPSTSNSVLETLGLTPAVSKVSEECRSENANLNETDSSEVDCKS